MYKWKRIKWRMIRFVYIFCVCCVYFVFCFSFHPFHSNSAICRWFLSENLVKCVRSFLFWLFVDERILFSIPIEFITHTDKFLIHNKRPTQCLHQRSDMRCYYGLCLWYWCSINWMHVKNCIGRKRFSGGEVSVEYEGITCTGVELNEKQQRQWRLKKKGNTTNPGAFGAKLSPKIFDIHVLCCVVVGAVIAGMECELIFLDSMLCAFGLCILY